HNLETTGAVIGCEEMIELSEKEGVICVGEIMNYNQVIRDENLEICKFLNYLRKNKPHYIIEGHCPRLMDLDLAKFLYLGINADHTEHSLEEIAQRFEQGMFVEIQHKMLKPEIIEYIKVNNLYEHFCLVTDDVMADDFVYEGHINVLVKEAIALGMRAEDAIYAATFTPARRMNLTDRGAIAPGKLADLVLVEDLKDFKIQATFKDGECIFDRKDPIKKEKNYTFPKDFYTSVQVKDLTLEHFNIQVETDQEKVTCRVIEVNDGMTVTREVLREIPVKEGKLRWEESDCLLAMVFERYGKNGNIGIGLVTGDCIKRGAVATTYAHDHHNLLVIGKSSEDMYLAAQRVIELQGGIVSVEAGKLKGEAQLNIGGILSDAPIEQLAENIRGIKAALINQGYKHYNPIMSLCTISLPVSPEIKLTDKGLIKVKENKCVSLIV
ncbi:MAG: adenine deaminase C-terminal domain-containing protein, partial [Cellulosilyticaceae bacterium]